MAGESPCDTDTGPCACGAWHDGCAVAKARKEERARCVAAIEQVLGEYEAKWEAAEKSLDKWDYGMISTGIVAAWNAIQELGTKRKEGE